MDVQDSTPSQKYCARCNQTKPLFDFGVDKTRKFGVKAYCKPCHNASNKATRQKHIEKHKAIEAAWRSKNKDKIKARTTAWRLNNPERSRELAYAWRKLNPEKLKQSQKRQNAKRNATPAGKLRKRISWAMRKTFQGFTKDAGMFRHLGYTSQELIQHLERQFLPGMTWDNSNKWHVDHIQPLSSFKYESVNDEAFKQAWALSNLRPLWASDNLTKYNKRVFLL